MLKYFLTLAGLLVLWGTAQPASAQSNQFRDTRAHLGIGVGLFTYYGPIDLTQPENNANRITESDPALVLMGSFPIVGDRFYFRGMIGFTNFESSEEKGLVQRRNGLNEFLTKPLFFFEPEVVMTLAPGSRSRILPYVYTGFGALLAGPFSGTGHVTNNPGSGIPGPERSVFAFPIGVGIDFALSPMFSFFIDASYRFNFNYVARNEVNGRNPHNTSLIMGGIRIGLKNPFRRTTVVEDVALGPLPEPVDIPAYRPPSPAEPPPRRCVLIELNSVWFAHNSTLLDREARAQLDANIEALRLNPECCVDVVGYRDGRSDSAYDLRIAQQRADVVYQYYLDRGIARDRLRTRVADDPLPPCDKKSTECPARVDSIPMDCDRFLRMINR